MKKIYFILFLILNFSLGFAQTFVPVKDDSALNKKIKEASQKTNTIQCDMVQEKNVSMLADKAVSKGKFYFKREDKILLNYTQPTNSSILMSAGKMLLKDDKKSQQMDLHRSKAFQQLNSIIVGSINGNLFTGKDFTTRFFETSTQVKVELKPLSKMLKNFLSTIIIVLDKKDFTANRIEMNETSGDNTILTFTNKVINTPLADALFAIK